MAGFGQSMQAMQGALSVDADSGMGMAPMGMIGCPICGGNHTPEEHQAQEAQQSFVDQVMGLEATNPDPVVTQPKTEQSTFGLNWGQTIQQFDPVLSSPWGPGHPHWPGGA